MTVFVVDSNGSTHYRKMTEHTDIVPLGSDTGSDDQT